MRGVHVLLLGDGMLTSSTWQHLSSWKPLIHHVGGVAPLEAGVASARLACTCLIAAAPNWQHSRCAAGDVLPAPLKLNLCTCSQASLGTGSSDMTAFPPLPRPLQPHHSFTLHTSSGIGAATIRLNDVRLPAPGPNPTLLFSAPKDTDGKAEDKLELHELDLPPNRQANVHYCVTMHALCRCACVHCCECVWARRQVCPLCAHMCACVRCMLEHTLTSPAMPCLASCKY